GMRELVHQVEGWQRMVAEQERRYPSEWQLENMLAVALAMANSALARKESRGVHFRNDFPGPSAEFAGRHVHYRVAAVPWLE
ncbi:MAG: hypothetical protein OEY28_11690, partial [Nitrospira sp.]|nr:hypothetical protein [Nitrospira sp.]